MKRAFNCLFGTFKREEHVQDMIHRLSQDQTSVAKDLLPLIRGSTAKQTADRLLDRLSAKSLGPSDAQWMTMLSILCKEEDLTTEDKEQIVKVMADKGQHCYLAQRYHELCIGDMLELMNVSQLDALYEEVTKHRDEAAAAPVKRRRRSTATDAVAVTQTAAYVVAQHLANRLLLGASASTPATCLRRRDLLVALYKMQEDEHVMNSLAEWFELSFALVNDDWGRLLDLHVLDALVRTLRGCVEGAGGAVCPFRAALADLARVCGERHEEMEDPLKAAEAFKTATMANGRDKDLKMRLLAALLRAHAVGLEVDKDEVVCLMGDTNHYDVTHFHSFAESFFKAMHSWGEEQSCELATQLQETGQVMEASHVYAHLAKILEDANQKAKAFGYYRRAFRLKPDEESEEGLLRLAVEVNCVQDAATEVLKPLIPAAGVVTMQKIFCMFKAYIDKRLATGGGALPKPDEPSGGALAYDSLLENLCADDSQSSQVVTAPPTPRTLPPPPETPRALNAVLESPAQKQPAPSTPISASKAAQLREKYPDRIPVMISPAMDPMSLESIAPMKFLVQNGATCADLKKSLLKRIAHWTEESKRDVLGSASELGHPLAAREAVGALDEQFGSDCLQLRFTLDDGCRVELFQRQR